MADDWMSLTPTELLGNCIVLNVAQTAYVLGLTVTRGESKGQPSRSAVYELIKARRLRVVDEDQTITRWTISCDEIRRYKQGQKS